MIDWNRVMDLRDEIGDDEFPEVAAMFLDEVDEVVARFDETPDNPSEDLHFLKGSALTLGFSDLARACTDGETQARAGGPADFDLVRRIYRDSQTAFLQGLSERGVQVNR